MTIRLQQLIQEALKNVDLKEGDIVLLHSDSTAVREITGLKWEDAMNLLNQLSNQSMANQGMKMRKRYTQGGRF